MPITLPMELYCDKRLPISIAHKPIQISTRQIKNVEIECHFIKENVKWSCVFDLYLFKSASTKGLSG